MIQMNGKIIQKPISIESYEIVMACKNATDKKRIEHVQDVIKELYGNCDYLSFEDLYTVLINTIIEVCDTKGTNNLLLYDIKEYQRRKEFMTGVSSLSLKDLCEILITKLTLLQMRERDKDKYVDLFILDIDSQIITIDEYKVKKKGSKHE